jgi:hypothetical protein
MAWRLRTQARWCARLGSPLYAWLLRRAAADVEEGGPVWLALEGLPVERADAAPLGLAGAVHRLVLGGLLPELAAFYPSAGGRWEGPTGEDPWPAFRASVAANLAQIRALAPLPIQTNEVGRAAALLGGFLLVSNETGLPLSLMEVGASGGLNLLWDRFRFESGAAAFGPADSTVRFVEPFVEGLPPLEVEAVVAKRAGCDLSPVDATTVPGRLTLMSYTWPDQQERFARLRGALEIAAREGVTVKQAEGIEWLGRELSLEPGVATVVFHSIIDLYLSPEQRDEMRRLLEEAARAATPENPLAWLRMEHPDTGDPAAEGWARLRSPEVLLTLWPGGRERLLARSAAHGPPVTWLGGRRG